MITIRVFCGGGMSSSILQNRMREAASKKNIEADIKAGPIPFIEKTCQNESVDAILIAPQMAYRISTYGPICDKYNVPYAIIPGLEYGRLNGEAVLKLATDLIDKNTK